ncbi:MAG: pyridoxamine 5'-phosphate oxidase family protein [Rhodobacteraceae bacterium]|nr:pyridoxamine 5'-phosphate oxidase family protein [Paracoccaceae bacterium]
MIETIEQLEALYGTPKPPSLVKVVDHITAEYGAFIKLSPFVALSTVGPEGLDCSPRGDDGQVVFIEDDKTLVLPDRRGNDRIDSLRNIVRDPRVSLMFLVPGSSMVVRVNGTGRISAAPDLLQRYSKSGKDPRSVILITVQEIYFQCARAIMRADLWNGPVEANLPTAGEILSSITDGAVGGADYDKTWPERAAKTMW